MLLPQDFHNAPQVDQIEILEMLGAGGMSIVYKARQIKLDRIVALKVLSMDLVSQTNTVTRFRREAKISSSLEHPNIAKVFGFGISAAGQPYLIMEYLKGKSLAEELETTERLSMQRFKDIFPAVLSALAYAHKSGLIHRDIKPANIMTCQTDDGADTIKLVDFGIAKEIASQAHLTATGIVLGSPDYMSPEQCEGKDLDGRSDLYSLSCVMYQALCDELPFTGESGLDVMHKHLSAPPPTVQDFRKRSGITKDLAKAILWGMAKKPELRPQNAAEMAAELNAVLSRINLEKALSARKSRKVPLPIRILLLSLLGISAVTGTVWLVFSNRNAGVSFSAHDLEVKAERLEMAGRHLDALTCYDRAIRKMENSKPVQKEKIARLLYDAMALLMRKVQVPLISERLLDYANKGINLSLDLPDEQGAISVSNRDLFEFFSISKCRLLKQLSRSDEDCSAGLDLLASAEKRWTKKSIPGLRTRYTAAVNFWECKQNDKAKSLALEGLSLARGDAYLSPRIKLKEMLALVYFSEHKPDKFLSLFESIKNELNDTRLKTLARVDIVDSLVRLFELSKGLPDIEPVLSKEIKDGKERLKEDSEYARRLALSCVSLAHYYQSAGKNADGCRAADQALSVLGNFQDRQIKSLRQICLQQLIFLSKTLGDSDAERKYQWQLARSNNPEFAPQTIYKRLIPDNTSNDKN